MPCLKIVKYVCKYVCVCVYARVHAWMKQEKHCNNDVRSYKLPCCGKAISIIYSECVCVSVALVTQDAKRMHHIILSSVACPALPYFFFPHYLIKGLIFVNTLLNIKCVF